MRKPLKQVTSTILAAILIINTIVLSGCSQNADEEPQVTDEFGNVIVGERAAERYFNVKSFDAPFEGEMSFSGTIQEAIYYDDEILVVYEAIGIGVQDETELAQGEDDDIYRYCKYSLQDDNFGELLCSIDAEEYGFYDVSDDYMIVSDAIDVSWADGNLQFLVQTVNYNDYTTTYKTVTVDMDTGDILDASDSTLLSLPMTETSNIQDVNFIDGQYWIAIRDWVSTNVHVCKLNANLELEEDISITNLNTYSVGGVADIIIIDSEYIFLCCYSNSGMEKGLVYNVQSEEITESEYSNTFNYSTWYSHYALGTDSLSLNQYDLIAGTKTIAVNYSNCNVNRNDILGLSVIAASEDKYICRGVNVDGNRGPKYVIFEETDVNPYEGKEVLRLAVLSPYVASQIYDAIYVFNQEHDSVYIYIDPNYIINDYADVRHDVTSTAYLYSEDYTNAMRDAASYVSNQLMVDIIAGIGPDIIVDGYQYNQFNSPNIMYDLNSLIDGDSTFNRDDYFSAIFYSDTDGLYQIPWNVSLMAISDTAIIEDYRNESYGITLDNYATYVSEECNGGDILRLEHNKLNYFLKLFNVSRSHFISDGVISIDNDYFRAIAQYCNDMSGGFPDYNTYSDILLTRGVNASLFADVSNGRRLIGYPSPDGAPIQLQCDGSLGITASCSNVDLAWDFAKVLFGLGNTNCELTRAVVEENTEYWNSIEYSPEDYVDPYDPTFVFIPTRFDEGAVDEYMNAYEAAVSVYTSDSDIDRIMYEEIQAYFAGDKTLDEVIPIIENRCQTVLDERG